ncbi:response regulator transcription factor, partial [Streptomyces sp. SID7499]|nr:response regulator transcription factor [Streptomyces sp. SID7499]
TTDEVAARELTVSVRTYRRYVAEIMTLLDATSRFQAGVRAAELGLLGSAGPGGAQSPQSRNEG